MAKHFIQEDFTNISSNMPFSMLFRDIASNVCNDALKIICNDALNIIYNRILGMGQVG